MDQMIVNESVFMPMGFEITQKQCLNSLEDRKINARIIGE